MILKLITKLHLIHVFIFELIFLYLTFLLFLFFFNFQSNFNCKEWPKGLNNTYIENDIKKYGCEIKTPKICPYKIGSYFLDLTRLFNVKCGRSLSAREKTLKFSKSPYVNKSTTKFGYPLTNKDPMCLSVPTRNSNINLYVSQNLLDMDNKANLNKTKLPEIVVDFSKNPYGEIIINVNYNETVSKERKELEKNSNPLENNIMLLIVNNDGHEGTLEILKYDDEYLLKFLTKLFKDNLLKETVVMILSDHGCTMPSIYHFNDAFNFDISLPMLYILSYDNKNLTYNKQYKYLYENQQKFITGYDIK